MKAVSERSRIPARPRAARLAVSVAFFVNGALLASWVPHIPSVQAKLALGNGALGLALLLIAAGAVTALLLSGWLIGRLGSRRVTRIGTVLLAVSAPLLVASPSLPLLIPFLLLFGAANGAMDVAMNAQGVAVEKRYPKPILSSFHGLYSAGGLVGAGLGGIALSVGFRPQLHMAAAALLLGGIGVAATAGLLPGRGEAPTGRPRLALPSRGVWGLCSLVFFCTIGEGAMADWSALYLQKVMGAAPAVAAAGYTAFSLMMAVGRLSGDFLVTRLRAAPLIRASALAAAAGLAAVLLLPFPAAGIAGFALVGIGLSNVIPIAFRAASNTAGLSPERGLASVATVSYTGLLAGPPIIGFAAQAWTLRGGMGVVLLCAVLVALLAPAARQS